MDKTSEIPSIKPRDLAKSQIFQLINQNPNYTFEDIMKIIGNVYPRRHATGSRFQYIVNRILGEYVYPDITDKKQRTLLRSKQISYEEEELKRYKIDPVTGIFSRRYFFERMEESIKNHNFKQRIVMLDIDHFKACNDTYGHPKGDEVLRQLAGIMRDNLNSVGIHGRYGGEEFITAIPDNVDTEEFRRRIEQIRQQFKEYSDVNFKIQSAFEGTISVGIYEANFGKGDTLELAVQKADDALYAAKKTRNAVVFWTPELKSSPKPVKK